MAKVQAPLLSFGAQGQVGKAMVVASWRGVPYVRRYAEPGNPNTLAQQQTRNIFRSLNRFWLFSPAAMQLAFDAFAAGKPFVGRNAFIGQNVRVLRDDVPLTSMEGLVASPGAKGGLPPATFGLTAGAGTIDVDVTLPTAPAGWSFVAAHAIAFIDQSPSDDFVQDILYETDPGPAPAPQFTGLEGGEDYVVSAWLEWLKPNGDTAYSISLSAVATPTV